MHPCLKKKNKLADHKHLNGSVLNINNFIFRINTAPDDNFIFDWKNDVAPFMAVMFLPHVALNMTLTIFLKLAELK